MLVEYIKYIIDEASEDIRHLIIKRKPRKVLPVSHPTHAPPTLPAPRFAHEKSQGFAQIQEIFN